MPTKQIRIVVDTNIWISFLISKKLIQLDKFIFNDKVKLLFSNELIDELIEVSKRDKFRKYFSNNDVTRLLELFNVYGELVVVNSKTNVCRDYKDNFLLSLSNDGNANYLISGDNDLLDLIQYGDTKIMTITDFEIQVLV
ncbi:MAG: putative toxin-antitoxin system toxin component, PIN family [Paludibacter sp.]